MTRASWLLVGVGVLGPCLLGCGEGRPPIVETGAAPSVSGLLVKGRVAGATVQLYRLEGDKRGAKLGEAVSGEDGTFTVPVGAGYGPFLVVAKSGSFVDEATGSAVGLGGEELTALVPVFSTGSVLSGLVVTPISHFQAGLALQKVRGGKSLSEADEEAWRVMNRHFGNFDWRKVTPVDLSAWNGTQLDEAAKAGLILAGLSQEASLIAQNQGLTVGARINVMTLVTALYEDIAFDGFFDGQGPGGQLFLPRDGTLSSGAYALDGLTLRVSLEKAIEAFMAGHRFAAHFTSADTLFFRNELAANSDGGLFREPGTAADGLPPKVALANQVARYTQSATATLLIKADDGLAGTGVRTVLARNVVNGGEVSSPMVATQEGDSWKLVVPLHPGPNRVVVWAEDFVAPANTGLGKLPPFNLGVDILRDNAAPTPTLTPFVSYFDERNLGLLESSPGVPLVPAQYTFGGAAKADASQRVYKASTRLSWGPVAPSAAELEGANAANTPSLFYALDFNPQMDAPFAKVIYQVEVFCPGCPAFPLASGSLLASSQAFPGRLGYLLPLSPETVPALGQLLSSPAKLKVSIRVEDAAGNLNDSPKAELEFYMVGAPLSMADETSAYAGANDGNSIYPFFVSDGTYANRWANTVTWRAFRYVIRNPAPLPVPVFFDMPSHSWEVVEKRGDRSFKTPAGGWAADGFNFASPSTWVVQANENTPRNFPCPSNSQLPSHNRGSSTQYVCLDVEPAPSSFDQPVVGRQALLQLKAFVNPSPSGGETQSPSPAGTGFWVPAAGGGRPGELVLYIGPQTVVPYRPPPYQDLGDGARMQDWKSDFWKPQSSSNFVCGQSGRAPAFCQSFDGYRVTTTVARAIERMSGTLSVATRGGTPALGVYGEAKGILSSSPFSREVGH